MEVITGIKINKIVAPGIILQMGLEIISCRLVMKNIYRRRQNYGQNIRERIRESTIPMILKEVPTK
jgi:hypothetical protein